MFFLSFKFFELALKTNKQICKLVVSNSFLKGGNLSLPTGDAAETEDEKNLHDCFQS